MPPEVVPMISEDQLRTLGVAMVAASLLVTMGCSSSTSLRASDAGGLDGGNDVADDVTGEGDAQDATATDTSDGPSADAPVQIVETFGCFAKSGDNYDILAEGSAAPVVPAG